MNAVLGIMVLGIAALGALAVLWYKLRLALQEQMQTMQQHLTQSMQQTRKEVELSKDVMNQSALKTFETIQSMNKVLHRLTDQQQGAQELAESLKYLLQSPKLRGSYGEAILEELLERVLPEGIWQKQYRICDGCVVDAVVHFKNLLVPIDAKFPREDYERYLHAERADEKMKHWKAYEDAVKKQIASIAQKYVRPEHGTTEFALMFIPSEAIYYETIAEKNSLGHQGTIYEYASDRKVTPVSPNTFYAFLQVILMGVRNVDIIKNAKKLQEGLKKIERDFSLLESKYQDVGDKLDKAQKSHQVAAGHLDRFRRNLEATVKLELPEQETPESLPEEVSSL